MANSSEDENEELIEFKSERKIDIEKNLSNQMKLEEGCQTLRQFIKSKGYRLTSRSIPYDELNRRKLSSTKNSNKIKENISSVDILDKAMVQKICEYIKYLELKIEVDCENQEKLSCKTGDSYGKICKSFLKKSPESASLPDIYFDKNNLKMKEVGGQNLKKLKLKNFGSTIELLVLIFYF